MIGHKVTKCAHHFHTCPLLIAVSRQDRLAKSKANILDHWLREYEIAQGEVAALKQQYLEKTRLADEAEDE
jgi:hypothetical protein